MPDWQEARQPSASRTLHLASVRGRKVVAETGRPTWKIAPVGPVGLIAVLVLIPGAGLLVGRVLAYSAITKWRGKTRRLSSCFACGHVYSPAPGSSKTEVRPRSARSPIDERPGRAIQMFTVNAQRPRYEKFPAPTDSPSSGTGRGISGSVRPQCENSDTTASP